MHRAWSALLLALAFTAAPLCAQNSDWNEPFPPHKVIGNVYYVGTRGLASYLITTPEGSILVNSSLESSVPMIRASIEKLGFKFSDVKILLISHAHYDHCAGSFQIKELTGAKYVVMQQDAGEIEAGGKGNFAYGENKSALYKPVKVDRVLHDGASHSRPHQRLYYLDTKSSRRRENPRRCHRRQPECEPGFQTGE